FHLRRGGRRRGVGPMGRARAGSVVRPVTAVRPEPVGPAAVPVTERIAVVAVRVAVAQAAVPPTVAKPQQAVSAAVVIGRPAVVVAGRTAVVRIVPVIGVAEAVVVVVVAGASGQSAERD